MKSTSKTEQALRRQGMMSVLLPESEQIRAAIIAGADLPLWLTALALMVVLNGIESARTAPTSEHSCGKEQALQAMDFTAKLASLPKDCVKLIGELILEVKNERDDGTVMERVDRKMPRIRGFLSANYQP